MIETTIFDFLYVPYKITKPIRLIELFAGIGAQSKALERLNANFEHYKVVEFDKFALDSYNAIHGTSFETSDITNIHGDDLNIVETDKYDYILTYSFPCQDLSLAGNQKGMSKGDNTRSGLLWEVERLLIECKDELPQILMMENVPMVHGKRNIEDFRKWINFLESLGYQNYYEDLNSKNYEIPQHRNRCFMISLLGEYTYQFPKKKKLKLKLKDLLEDNVDEKYFLNEKQINYILGNACNEELKDYYDRKKAVFNKDIAYTISTKQDRRIGDSNFIITNIDGEVTVEQYLKIKCKTKKGYLEAYEGDGIYISNIEGKRGTVQRNMIPTLKTSPDIGVVVEELKVRKLTPLECFRLMGFDDEDYHSVKDINSNNQLYKQAGNSIVVNVLEAIFKQLL